MRDLPMVAVYADESCLGNGRDGENPGGAGGLIEIQHPRTGALIRRDYWVSEPATTNNRMALRSMIEALQALSAKGQRFNVLFTSDSQYLVEGNEQWLHDWIRRGWKRKTGRIENLELWQEVAELRERQNVRCAWVRGHAGHPQNEYANERATRAARDQSNSGGPVPSRFGEWLAAERARGRGRGRGRMALEPDPFPDPAHFRPGRALPPVPGGRLL